MDVLDVENRRSVAKLEGIGVVNLKNKSNNICVGVILIIQKCYNHFTYLLIIYALSFFLKSV